MTWRPGQAVHFFQRMVAGIPLGSILVVVPLLSAAGCSEGPQSSEALPSYTAHSGDEHISSPAGEASDTGSVRSDSRRSIGLVGTVYYGSSPAQGRPPDGELSVGTSVELLEEAGSYSLVTWDGRRAWVSTDALQKSEPAPRKIHKIPMH